MGHFCVVGRPGRAGAGAGAAGDSFNEHLIRKESRLDHYTPGVYEIHDIQTYNAGINRGAYLKSWARSFDGSTCNIS
jgi:hypothetical protein